MKDDEFMHIMFSAIRNAYLQHGMDIYGRPLLCSDCQSVKDATRARVRKFRSKNKTKGESCGL